MFCQNPTLTVSSSHFKHCGPVEVGPVVCAKMLYLLWRFEASEFSDPKALSV